MSTPTVQDVNFENPLAAVIVADMLKQVEEVTGNLVELQAEQIDFWKQQYLHLFESLVAANHKDSRAITEGIILDHNQLAEIAMESFTKE